MVLLIVALIVIGFVFPPAWLALVGLGIYLVASRKSRRSDAIESRVKKMVSAGKDYAVFADLYFEAARSYAIAKGAKAADENAASAHIVVDGRTYFVVFTRAASGGTIFGVEEADSVRKRIFDDVMVKSQKSAPDPAPASRNDKTKPKSFGAGLPPSSMLTDLDFPTEILLVTRSGKVLMTSESLECENREHLDGKIFEIMVKMCDGDPFFIYYKCEEYYFLLMRPGSILEAQSAQQWRTDVSEKALVFLREFILHTAQKDIGPSMVSYHHNAKHTNVAAYVERLDGWYPIQQNDSDHEDTTELKVVAVNNGSSEISQFIAISDLSPSG
jgi:hypothetical protein